jgi:hypothetical protein
MPPTDPAPPLPDGTYDAIVVDAHERDGGAVALELTVLAGPHKGEVVEVRGPSSEAAEPYEHLGVPATLTVADGRPTVVLAG